MDELHTSVPAKWFLPVHPHASTAWATGTAVFGIVIQSRRPSLRAGTSWSHPSKRTQFLIHCLHAQVLE